MEAEIKLSNTAITVILIIAAFIVSIGIYSAGIIPLMEERRYIKMEMKRADSEQEYRYWKRELRGVYMRRFPFVRHFVK